MYATVVIRGLQELGCYRLVEKLDHGGMGEIWRARHRMLARPVAVKLIRPELIGVKSAPEAAALVSRFRREAEATAALHSPHTVSLHDFGVTPEGAFYYVMELLDGLDLETLVRRFGPVPPERAVHLLAQACDSLAEAHATGLVHRDVKPANIVACRWGLKWDFVKVLDFGLVKATWNLGEDEHLTSEGTITGTPAYMAPEAALGGRDIDARVDLYGLGCVALLAAHGAAGVRRPHAGRGPAAPREDPARPALGALRPARPARPRGARPLLPRQGAGRAAALRRVARLPPRGAAARGAVDARAREGLVGGERPGRAARRRRPARRVAPVLRVGDRDDGARLAVGSLTPALRPATGALDEAGEARVRPPG